MVDTSTSCLCNYYAVFRKMIYDRQYKELLSFYTSNPQQGKYRRFFDKYSYFYVYKYKVFVREKFLSYYDEKNFRSDEIRELNVCIAIWQELYLIKTMNYICIIFQQNTFGEMKRVLIISNESTYRIKELSTGKTSNKEFISLGNKTCRSFSSSNLLCSNSSI